MADADGKNNNQGTAFQYIDFQRFPRSDSKDLFLFGKLYRVAMYVYGPLCMLPIQLIRHSGKTFSV